MATAPHPTLEKHYRKPEERQEYVDSLFDTAAPHYDWICQVMSFGSGQLYRRQALERLGLRPGMRLLDVATGTGPVARAAAQILGDPRAVVGLDPSAGMLAQARQAVSSALVQGRGEALPFASGHFDALSMGYALRHVPDLAATFREYYRVLKPGGKVLLLEISRPRSRAAFLATRFYMKTIVPFVTRVGTGSRPAGRLMEYYWDTIENCVAPETILDALSQVGFEARRKVFGALLSEYVAVRPAAGLSQRP
jgi:demethylmenaquinone methyltransferase / 2-methoxy-6-polyprenyl-1,4-benzoquinol methylase